MKKFNAFEFHGAELKDVHAHGCIAADGTVVLVLPEHHLSGLTYNDKWWNHEVNNKMKFKHKLIATAKENGGRFKAVTAEYYVDENGKGKHKNFKPMVGWWRIVEKDAKEGWLIAIYEGV